jgi:hypothetical protein
MPLNAGQGPACGTASTGITARSVDQPKMIEARTMSRLPGTMRLQHDSPMDFYRHRIDAFPKAVSRSPSPDPNLCTTIYVNSQEQTRPGARADGRPE